MALTDVYRTSYPDTKYTLFSAGHDIFFKGNHLIRQGQVLIKLGNLLLSDEWAREEIKKEIWTFVELNKNEHAK